MRYVLQSLPYTGKDMNAIGAIDPLILGRANTIYEKGEHSDILLQLSTHLAEKNSDTFGFSEDGTSKAEVCMFPWSRPFERHARQWR